MSDTPGISPEPHDGDAGEDLPRPGMTEDVEFIGPTESYDVVVSGRRVPYLQAEMLNGGRVLLELDRRMAVELDLQEAHRIVPFIAHCIAVAAGYTCHPEADWGEPKPRHLMPRVRFIDPQRGAQRPDENGERDG